MDNGEQNKCDIENKEVTDECGNKVEMRTLFPNCKTSSSWSTIVQIQATIGKEVVSSAFVRISQAFLATPIIMVIQGMEFRFTAFKIS